VTETRTDSASRSVPAARLRSAILIALLAAAVHLPGAGVPIAEDEIHSVWQAARSIRDPHRMLLPWMGGAVRLLPKLVFMAGVRLWGPAAWPYKLVAIALYACCAALVYRVGTRWSGSARVGAWGGVLFAVGFGVYWKSVLVASNITMLLGILFLLLSVDALWSGRWKVSLALFVLAAASHEIVLVAPALLPLLVIARRERAEIADSDHVSSRVLGRRAGRTVAAVVVAFALASFLPGSVGRLSSIGVTMASFLLFPLNAAALAGLGGGAGGSAVALVLAVIQQRYWMGVGVLAALGCLAWRGRGFRSLAIAWIVVFFVPSAFVVGGWEEGWLEVRYLAVSAVGLCLITGRLIEWLERRRRAAAVAALCLLTAWSVVIGSLWLRKHVATALGPEWVAERQELLEALSNAGFGR